MPPSSWTLKCFHSVCLSHRKPLVSSFIVLETETRPRITDLWPQGRAHLWPRVRVPLSDCWSVWRKRGTWCSKATEEGKSRRFQQTRRCTYKFEKVGFFFLIYPPKKEENDCLFQVNWETTVRVLFECAGSLLLGHAVMSPPTCDRLRPCPTNPSRSKSSRNSRKTKNSKNFWKSECVVLMRLTTLGLSQGRGPNSIRHWSTWSTCACHSNVPRKCRCNNKCTNHPSLPADKWSIDNRNRFPSDKHFHCDKLWVLKRQNRKFRTHKMYKHAVSNFNSSVSLSYSWTEHQKHASQHDDSTIFKQGSARLWEPLNLLFVRYANCCLAPSNYCFSWV